MLIWGALKFGVRGRETAIFTPSFVGAGQAGMMVSARQTSSPACLALPWWCEWLGAGETTRRQPYPF
ncbi:MAG: hypothetical protein AAF614_20915 [Chloroflexota bacterium]